MHMGETRVQVDSKPGRAARRICGRWGERRGTPGSGAVLVDDPSRSGWVPRRLLEHDGETRLAAAYEGDAQVVRDNATIDIGMLGAFQLKASSRSRKPQPMDETGKAERGVWRPSANPTGLSVAPSAERQQYRARWPAADR